MIVGLGIDLVEIERIKRTLVRFGKQFTGRILHESESDDLDLTDQALLSSHMAARIAARFAAKEAAVKALGTGFTGGIQFRDIRVFSGHSGKPELQFFGPALKRFYVLGSTVSHLSLTHARDSAGAVVVLEALLNKRDT